MQDNSRGSHTFCGCDVYFIYHAFFVPDTRRRSHQFPPPLPSSSRGFRAAQRIPSSRGTFRPLQSLNPHNLSEIGYCNHQRSPAKHIREKLIGTISSTLPHPTPRTTVQNNFRRGTIRRPLSLWTPENTKTHKSRFGKISCRNSRSSR